MKPGSFKLLTGDNVEVLARGSADTVDLTVTSPPYDDLRVYNGFNVRWRDLVSELYRVTKPGGVVVWVVNDKTKDGDESGSSFEQALIFKEGGFKLWDTMIWRKTNPMPSDGRIKRYQQAFEYMFVFSKNNPKTCNHLKVPTKFAGADPSKRSNNYPARRENGRKSDERVVSQTKKIKTDRVMHNVWDMPVHGHTDEFAKKHPATFPEILAQNHILTWSNPGDLVLDPFAGSGTTGKMAILHGRNFVGIDISDEYITTIARPRLYNTYQSAFSQHETRNNPHASLPAVSQ